MQIDHTKITHFVLLLVIFNAIKCWPVRSCSAIELSLGRSNRQLTRKVHHLQLCTRQSLVSSRANSSQPVDNASTLDVRLRLDDSRSVKVQVNHSREGDTSLWCDVGESISLSILEDLTMSKSIVFIENHHDKILGATNDALNICRRRMSMIRDNLKRNSEAGTKTFSDDRFPVKEEDFVGKCVQLIELQRSLLTRSVSKCNNQRGCALLDESELVDCTPMIQAGLFPSARLGYVCVPVSKRFTTRDISYFDLVNSLECPTNRSIYLARAELSLEMVATEPVAGNWADCEQGGENCSTIKKEDTPTGAEGETDDLEEFINQLDGQFLSIAGDGNTMGAEQASGLSKRGLDAGKFSRRHDDELHSCFQSKLQTIFKVCHSKTMCSLSLRKMLAEELLRATMSSAMASSCNIKSFRLQYSKAKLEYTCIDSDRLSDSSDLILQFSSRNHESRSENPKRIREFLILEASNKQILSSNLVHYEDEFGSRSLNRTWSPEVSESKSSAEHRFRLDEPKRVILMIISIISTMTTSIRIIFPRESWQQNF